LADGAQVRGASTGRARRPGLPVPVRPPDGSHVSRRRHEENIENKEGAAPLADPFRHVVLLMLATRSFDHMLGVA
jgi:phospholipase C